MSDRPTYRIVGGMLPQLTHVYRNGERLTGVEFIKYEADANGICMLTLREEASVEIEWTGDEGVDVREGEGVRP